MWDCIPVLYATLMEEFTKVPCLVLTQLWIQVG